ncbi:hypothetical protein HYT01_02530 [Candidatus Giovannonibacteria bacterium]|nr:hypothetical protein [Candidatus Giovannonibacteria bacterium]
MKKISIFSDNREWIEKLSAEGVFEEKITEWIWDLKNGGLTEEDILLVTAKVAKHRNSPELVEEIRKRIALKK